MGRRAAGRANRRFHLTERAQRARQRTQSVLGDSTAWLEKKLDLKRRMQRLTENVQQNAPKWGRQLGVFNQSALGKFFWSGVGVLLIHTGVFWSIIRVISLFIVLLPVLVAVFARTLSKKMENLQAQARAQMQQQEQGPFGSAFRGGMGGPMGGMGGGMGGPMGGMGGSRGMGGGRQARKPGPDFSQQPGGPIIDVESYTVDEYDK